MVDGARKGDCWDTATMMAACGDGVPDDAMASGDLLNDRKIKHVAIDRMRIGPKTSAAIAHLGIASPNCRFH